MHRDVTPISRRSRDQLPPSPRLPPRLASITFSVTRRTAATLWCSHGRRGLFPSSYRLRPAGLCRGAHS
eukprot:4857115-Alexandrium_andersonii.AAC.1